jgi:SAM-dependent methyltransferase
MLPYENNTFDLVLSAQVLEYVKDQVAMLKELRRIMKPGGVSMHIFPARYSFIEPYIYVPLGGVLAHRWWYFFWAKLGIQNEFQTGLDAGEVTHFNLFYFCRGSQLRFKILLLCFI